MDNGKNRDDRFQVVTRGLPNGLTYTHVYCHINYSVFQPPPNWYNNNCCRFIDTTRRCRWVPGGKAFSLGAAIRDWEKNRNVHLIITWTGPRVDLLFKRRLTTASVNDNDDTRKRTLKIRVQFAPSSGGVNRDGAPTAIRIIMIHDHREGVWNVSCKAKTLIILLCSLRIF